MLLLPAPLDPFLAERWRFFAVGAAAGIGLLTTIGAVVLFRLNRVENGRNIPQSFTKGRVSSIEITPRAGVTTTYEVRR